MNLSIDCWGVISSFCFADKAIQIFYLNKNNYINSIFYRNKIKKKFQAYYSLKNILNDIHTDIGNAIYSPFHYHDEHDMIEELSVFFTPSNYEVLSLHSYFFKNNLNRPKIWKKRGTKVSNNKKTICSTLKSARFGGIFPSNPTDRGWQYVDAVYNCKMNILVHIKRRRTIAALIY